MSTQNLARALILGIAAVTALAWLAIAYSSGGDEPAKEGVGHYYAFYEGEQE